MNTQITWTTRNRLLCGDRPFHAFINTAGLFIHSWHAATITKVAGGFAVTSKDSSTIQLGTIKAKTRKAAVELFVAAYVVELVKPIDPAKIDRSYRPCPTCGSVMCASRFDCVGRCR